MLASAARLLCRAALLVVIAGAAACRDKSAPTPQPSSAPAPLPPVEEPSGIGATLVVKDGGETWGRLRALAGDRIGLVPLSLGGAVTFATGLPITSAELFGEHDPVVGAALEPSLFAPGTAVVAFHLRAADRLIALATRGESAAFVARWDAAANADLLEPLGTPSTAPGARVALGVFGNYLVVGTSADALRELGPYVTRNLAAEPIGNDAVHLRLRPSLCKLAAPLLHDRIASLGYGRASLLGKLALEDALASAARANGADLVLEAGADDVALSLVMSRTEAASSATAASGPVADLLSLPATTDVGVLAFEASDKRRAEGAEIEAAAAPYLDASDREAFAGAFGALTSARGDGFTLGFENGLLGPAFYGRVDITDRDSARRALGALVEVSARKSVAAAFAKHGLDVTAKETVVEHVGDVVRVRLAASPEAASTSPGAVNLLARMSDGKLALGSGADATAALRLMLDGPSLSSDARASALVAKLPRAASLAVIADPARVVHGATVPRSCLAAALVEDATETRANVVLDERAVRSLIDAFLR